MKKKQLKNKYPNSSLEQALLKEGYSHIIGIDEAGRGAWAGPLAMAAYIYSQDLEPIAEIQDSKLLTPSKREELIQKFQPDLSYLEFIPSQFIDKYGLSKAVSYSISCLVERIKLKNAIYLIDGNYKLKIPANYRSIIAGDRKHLVISAASIIAKVRRDRLMLEYNAIFPEYGFNKHKGYGTREHLKALKTYGTCPIHRLTFKPLLNI